MKIKLTEAQYASPMPPSTAQLSQIALRKVQVSESVSKFTAPCATWKGALQVKDDIDQDKEITLFTKGDIFEVLFPHIYKICSQCYYQTGTCVQRRNGDYDRRSPFATLNCIPKDINMHKLNILTQRSLMHRVQGFAVNPSSSDLSLTKEPNRAEIFPAIAGISAIISRSVTTTLQSAPRSQIYSGHNNRNCASPKCVG